MKTSNIIWSLSLAALLAGTGAQAALVGRAPLTPGGADYQAYYDDVLDITWLTDADYAKTSGYDADGLMTWSASLGWIASLNSVSHLSVNNWRLPAITDTGTAGCNIDYGGTDCGWSVDLSTGEMAHLYYSTLGNAPFYSSQNLPTGCSIIMGGGSSQSCLSNTGPFSNLVADPWNGVNYWSGTSYDTTGVWMFNFEGGSQTIDSKSNLFRAWAVTDGDALAVVPIPHAAWLFGSALGMVGWVRRSPRL